MEDSEYVELDRFKVGTKDLLERFSLKKTKDIVAYVKEHYQSKGCLQQLRKDLQGVAFKDDWSLLSLDERVKEMEDKVEQKMQECYAEKANYESEDAEDESLEELEAQGIVHSADKIMEELRSKLSNLEGSSDVQSK